MINVRESGDSSLDITLEFNGDIKTRARCDLRSMNRYKTAAERPAAYFIGVVGQDLNLQGLLSQNSITPTTKIYLLPLLHQLADSRCSSFLCSN